MIFLKPQVFNLPYEPGAKGHIDLPTLTKSPVVTGGAPELLRASWSGPTATAARRQLQLCVSSVNTQQKHLKPLKRLQDPRTEKIEAFALKSD